MASLNYSLWLGLALVAVAVSADGQEPVLTGPPVLPEMAAETPQQAWPADASYANCYPMYRCEDNHCCNQWWCETWYGRVEMLTLARNYAVPNQTIIANGGTPLFTSDNIGFKLAPGVSTLLGQRLDGNTAV